MEENKQRSVLQLLWAKKFLILAIALLVAFLPMALTQEAVVLSKALLTSIGIEMDEDNEQYVVWGEHMIFNFDPFGVPERELVSGRGKDLDEAFVEMGRNLGKTVSLSHCTIIILHESLQGENIAELLWDFFKDPHPVNSCILFYTESGVGDLMDASINRGDARSGRLQQIAEFNRRQRKMESANLEDFMKSSVRAATAICVRDSIETKPSQVRTSNTHTHESRTQIAVAAVIENEGEIENRGDFAIFESGFFAELVIVGGDGNRPEDEPLPHVEFLDEGEDERF